MAESHLSGQVIGVAFDGTGYRDGRKNMGRRIPDLRTIAGFTRRAHLRYVPLPGGDAAVRSALADGTELSVAMPSDNKFPDRTALALQASRKSRLELVNTMLTKGSRRSKPRACGRLFDAVAALPACASEVTYRRTGSHAHWRPLRPRRAGNRKIPVSVVDD